MHHIIIEVVISAPYSGDSMPYSGDSAKVLVYLEPDILSILESHHLITPVEEVRVVDDVAPKFRVVQHAGVIQPQIISLWSDESVTEAGLACPLPRQTRETGRCEATHGHSNDLPCISITSHSAAEEMRRSIH